MPPQLAVFEQSIRIFPSDLVMGDGGEVLGATAGPDCQGCLRIEVRGGNLYTLGCCRYREVPSQRRFRSAAFRAELTQCV